ncbi:MAG: hypothetical protein MR304_07200 [Eubacterium sp.]|nr:hypothetical protein [Eubacterium sp.]
MNWLRRVMAGRYGNDQLGNFLFAVYLLLFVLQLMFRTTVISPVCILLSYLVIILYFFRCLSRNIYKRQMENQKFLKAWNPVKNYFKFCRLRMKERSGTKKLYRCPKCHQTIRVPKGRGKIAISCPKCRFEFIKKT